MSVASSIELLFDFHDAQLEPFYAVHVYVVQLLIQLLFLGAYVDHDGYMAGVPCEPAGKHRIAICLLGEAGYCVVP